MWKRARVDKTKAFITEESKLIAKKIDSFKQQCTQGEFIESGKMDILALEKKEHSGCVRGVGREDNGIRDFFGSTPLCEGYVTMETAQHMICAAISKRVAENTAELKQIFYNTMAEATAKFQQLPAYLDQNNNLCVPEPSPDLHSDEAISPDPLENIPMVGVPCVLYLENPIRRVAMGKVFGMGHTLHGIPLPHDQVKVVIEKVIEPQTKVPFPTEEASSIGGALDQYIAWPKKSIQLLSQKRLKCKATHEAIVEQSPLPKCDRNSLSNDCMKAYKIASHI